MNKKALEIITRIEEDLHELQKVAKRKHISACVIGDYFSIFCEEKGGKRDIDIYIDGGQEQ